jgi:hypothetical protein
MGISIALASIADTEYRFSRTTATSRADGPISQQLLSFASDRGFLQLFTKDLLLFDVECSQNTSYSVEAGCFQYG